MENHHLQWIFQLKMVIFHSYVSLPEGTSQFRSDDQVPQGVTEKVIAKFSGTKTNIVTELPEIRT